MSNRVRRGFSVRVLGIAFAAVPLGAACSAGSVGPDEASDQTLDALSACSVSITKNTYVGDPDYWGTIAFTNKGSASMKSPTLSFQVPSGVTCDYDPSGWKHTQSGTTCTYSRTSALTVKAGSSHTFHYSTDSAKSFKASSVVVSDASCGSGGSGGGGTKAAIGPYVITWYSFQDNTPVNSAQSSSGRKLIPYISVAVPFTQLKAFGGKFNYGDKLYLELLKGRTMPNGMKHTGWVQIDDFCGDNSDDSYCYQTVGGKKYPNTDLYIGDFTKSGMAAKSGDCSGPAGSGQELTQVYSGDPGSEWVGSYGGAALGSGKCGDTTSAVAQQGGKSGGCWHYTPPASSAQYCKDCTKDSCSSW